MYMWGLMQVDVGIFLVYVKVSTSVYGVYAAVWGYKQRNR